MLRNKYHEHFTIKWIIEKECFSLETNPQRSFAHFSFFLPLSSINIRLRAMENILFENSSSAWKIIALISVLSTKHCVTLMLQLKFFCCFADALTKQTYNLSIGFMWKSREEMLKKTLCSAQQRCDFMGLFLSLVFFNTSVQNALYPWLFLLTQRILLSNRTWFVIVN